MQKELQGKIEVARNLILTSWPKQDFDHLALAFFNLNEKESAFIEIHEGEEKSWDSFYFDLASLTKPLTMGALWAKSPELFKGENQWLLEHRAGLPSWAILGRKSWKETVNSFSIKESDTVYSDLSYLRLMLEIEEATGKGLKELTDFFWDSELCFWKDLPQQALSPVTGFRQKEVIQGQVNDDNCYKIDQFCSHAGLFATIKGLYKSLVNLNDQVGLIEKMREAFKEKRQSRFLYGWDTVSDSNQSLAGIGCPPHTFGHLGFTGTSFWIDAESSMGWILLTNATKKYWFHREELNSLRRDLGSLVFRK